MDSLKNRAFAFFLGMALATIVILPLLSMALLFPDEEQDLILPRSEWRCLERAPVTGDCQLYEKVFRRGLLSKVPEVN